MVFARTRAVRQTTVTPTACAGKATSMFSSTGLRFHGSVESVVVCSSGEVRELAVVATDLLKIPSSASAFERSGWGKISGCSSREVCGDSRRGLAVGPGAVVSHGNWQDSHA
ncbi:hypothetical protein [Streptomyces sp. ISL-10]|uniref:hypothetical protein n=1 Tax=Streptomyces sp. ISL-10 TaxID=2819172 RepID=UPI002035B5C1|nr:hypothetical protein [Streptomyces sp. ISL-10]